MADGKNQKDYISDKKFERLGIKNAICAVDGKSFLCDPLVYSYKARTHNGTFYFCSYSCFLKWQNERLEQIQKEIERDLNGGVTMDGLRLYAAEDKSKLETERKKLRECLKELEGIGDEVKMMLLLLYDEKLEEFDDYSQD